MRKRLPPFDESDRIKILLWSERHCCLCDKPCDTNIEIHHIRQEGADEELSSIENAIPLCYECHGRIHSRNPKGAIGTAYRISELTARRDQIYEKYTRHLVPITHYEITQIMRRNLSYPLRQLPDVGFNIEHVDPRFLPVTAKVEVKCLLDEDDKGIMPDPSGYYNGMTNWNLNPSFLIFGHFSVSEKCVAHVKSKKDFKIEVRVTIIDQYGRQHRHLPLCWTYDSNLNNWYIEPRSFATWT